MATNRLMFRKSVAPYVAGVFMALFSAGASGEDLQKSLSCSDVLTADWAACGGLNAGFKDFYVGVYESDKSSVDSVFRNVWVPSPAELLTSSM